MRQVNIKRGIGFTSTNSNYFYLKTAAMSFDPTFNTFLRIWLWSLHNKRRGFHWKIVHNHFNWFVEVCELRQSSKTMIKWIQFFKAIDWLYKMKIQVRSSNRCEKNFMLWWKWYIKVGSLYSLTFPRVKIHSTNTFSCSTFCIHLQCQDIPFLLYDTIRNEICRK